MTAVQISTRVPSRFSRMRWARNGKIPTATLMTKLSGQLNHVLGFQQKELFGYYALANSAGAGARERYNFRCHTGTHTRQIGIQMMLQMTNTGANADPYTKCTVTTAGGGTLGSVEFHFGNTGSGPAGGAGDFGVGTMYLNCSANTAYEIAFADYNDGRLAGCTVFEIAKFFDTDFGYLETNFSMLGPIYDSHRLAILQKATEAWRFNAARVITWSVNLVGSPVTRTSATPANLLDQTVTTFTGATPAWQSDLTYKNSISSTTVKCVVAAQASRATAGTATIALVRVSDGVTVASLSVTSSTRQWLTTTADLNPTVERYCIMINGTGSNALTIYAVSVYEYLA